MNTDHRSLRPGALATDLVDVILPPVPMEVRTFEGDASALIGVYTGRALGRQISITIAAADDGLTVSANPREVGSQLGPEPVKLLWAHGHTFRIGTDSHTITFERSDNAGRASLVRFDIGFGHYVLQRERD